MFNLHDRRKAIYFSKGHTRVRDNDVAIMLSIATESATDARQQKNENEKILLVQQRLGSHRPVVQLWASELVGRNAGLLLHFQPRWIFVRIVRRVVFAACN
jgi:hypothetical protein